MLTELVATAREAGCPDVLLEVRQSNEAAQRLYTRHGFVSIGRRRRYYQVPPEDAVVMRLSLRPRPGPVGARPVSQARSEPEGRLTGSEPRCPTGWIALEPKRQIGAAAAGDQHGPREDKRRV